MVTNFDSLVSTAAKTLDFYFKKHNISLDSDTYLKSILESMGIDNTDVGLETLGAASLDDFEKAFERLNLDIPLPRLKLCWSVFKDSNKEKQETSTSTGNLNVSTLIETLRPIGQWSDLELLEKYGKNCPLEIEEELKKRCKGRNCIVFFEDGTIDVENSLYVFRKARYQETPSTFMFQNQLKQVFKIGEYPLDILFECPVHKNVLLIDGYCEECCVTWDTKNTERLAFIRLIKESITTDHLLGGQVLNVSMNMDELKKVFPKVYLKFIQLKDEDKLPSLKRRISRVREGDPFRVSAHRTF